MSDRSPQPSSCFDKKSLKCTDNTLQNEKEIESLKQKNHGVCPCCYAKHVAKMMKNKRKSNLSQYGASRRPRSFIDLFRRRRCDRRRRFTARNSQLPQNAGPSTSNPGTSRDNNASAMVYMPAKQFTVHYGKNYLLDIASNAFKNYLDNVIPKINIRSLYREHISSRFSVMSFIEFKCIIKGRLEELKQHLRELIRMDKRKKRKVLRDGEKVVLVDRAIMGAARKALRNRPLTRVNLRRLDDSVFDGAKVVLQRLDVSTLRRYGVSHEKESCDTTVAKDTYEQVEKNCIPGECCSQMINPPDVKGTEKLLVCEGDTEDRNKTGEMAFGQRANSSDIEDIDNSLVCEEDIAVQNVCEEIALNKIAHPCNIEGCEERWVFEEDKRDENVTEDATLSEIMNQCDTDGTEKRLICDEGMGVEKEIIKNAFSEMTNSGVVEGTEECLVDNEDIEVENETVEIAFGEMMNSCGVEGIEKRLVFDEDERDKKKTEIAFKSRKEWVVQNVNEEIALGQMMNPYNIEETEERLAFEGGKKDENKTEEISFGETVNMCDVEGTNKRLAFEEDISDQNISEEIPFSQILYACNVEETEKQLRNVNKSEQITFGQAMSSCNMETTHKLLVGDENKAEEMASSEMTKRCDIECIDKRLVCNEEDTKHQNVSEEIAFGSIFNLCDVKETEKYLVYVDDMGDQSKTVETAFNEMMNPCDIERTKEHLVCEEDRGNENTSEKIAFGQTMNQCNMERTEKLLVGDKTEEKAFRDKKNPCDIEGTKNLFASDEDMTDENKSVPLAFGQMTNASDIECTEKRLVSDKETRDQNKPEITFRSKEIHNILSIERKEPKVGFCSKKSGEILKRVYSDERENTKSHKTSKKLKVNKSCQTLPVAKALKVGDFSRVVGKGNIFPNNIFSNETTDKLVNARLAKNVSPTKDIATATHGYGPMSNENKGKQSNSLPAKQKNIEKIINNLRIQRCLEGNRANLQTLEVEKNCASQSKKSLEKVFGSSNSTPSIKKNAKPIKLYGKEENMESSRFDCIDSAKKQTSSEYIACEEIVEDTVELPYNNISTAGRDTFETSIVFDTVKLSTSNQNENLNEFPSGNELPPFKIFKKIRSYNVIENEPRTHVGGVTAPISSNIYGINSKNQLSTDLQFKKEANTKFETFDAGHDNAAKCVEENLYVERHNYLANHASEIEITFENINRAIESDVNPQIKYNKVNSVLDAYGMRNNIAELGQSSNNLEETLHLLKEGNSDQLNSTNDLANINYVQNVDSYFTDCNSFHDIKLKSIPVYPPRILQGPEGLGSTLKRGIDSMKADHSLNYEDHSGPQDLSLKSYKGTGGKRLSTKFHKVAPETPPSVDDRKHCVCAQSYSMEDLMKTRTSFKDFVHMEDAQSGLNTNFTKDTSLSLNRAKTPNGKNYLKYTVEFLSKHNDTSDDSVMSSNFIEDPFLFFQVGTVNSHGCLSNQGDYDGWVKRKYTSMNY